MFNVHPCAPIPTSPLLGTGPILAPTTVYSRSVAETWTEKQTGIHSSSVPRCAIVSTALLLINPDKTWNNSTVQYKDLYRSTYDPNTLFVCALHLNVVVQISIHHVSDFKSHIFRPTTRCFKIAYCECFLSVFINSTLTSFPTEFKSFLLILWFLKVSCSDEKTSTSTVSELTCPFVYIYSFNKYLRDTALSEIIVGNIFSSR